MKNRNHLLALLALLLTGTARAQVPVLINYQGRVAVGGVNFDSTTAGHPGQFKFALVNTDGTTSYWSNDRSSANGSEPGSAVSLSVVKGLYSVLLGDNSLGATMRTIGAPDLNYSDVRLRVWFSDGTNGFQLLTPDQRLAPAAYLADETVTSTKLASNLTLPGTTTGTFSGNGSALTSVTASNVVPGAIIAPSFMAGAPIAGQVLGYNGTGLTWTAPGGGVFALNGTNAYYNGGNVGIGTSTATSRLELLTSGGGYGLTHTSGTINLRTYLGGSTGGAFGAWLGSNTDHPLYLYSNNSEPRLTVATNGNIGIGTITPQSKLEVTGAVRINSASGIALNAEDSPIITRGFDPFNLNAPLNLGGHGRWGLFKDSSSLIAGIPDIAGDSFQICKYTPDGGRNVLVITTRDGNVGIGTGPFPGPQQKLHVIGNILASGTITGSSDRNVKRDFAPVNNGEILDKVVALPISTWSYIADDGTRHLGPMAQDFYSAFHVGMDDKHISMVDADGVALAAIQGLNQKVKARDAEIRNLRVRLEKLEYFLGREIDGTESKQP